MKTIQHIIAVSFIFFLCASCKSKAADDAEGETVEARTPVTIGHIIHDTMSDFIEVNATSAFLLKSFVKANATGYLQSANIQIGQFVSQGQKLFTIKTKEAENLGNTINSLDSSFKFSGTNSIKAGESGYITELNHQPGDYIQDGEQLAVINNINSFVFIMNVPYELRPNIRIGGSVTLILPDGQQLSGTITSTLPSVDSTAQTQRTVIKVNGSKVIPENLVAKVRIRKAFKENALSVPKSAVLTDETQSEFWIMKMMDSNTAVKVQVKKGMENSENIEIVSPPLNDSDQILISGNYGLEDTAKVKIIQTKQ